MAVFNPRPVRVPKTLRPPKKEAATTENKVKGQLSNGESYFTLSIPQFEDSGIVTGIRGPEKSAAAPWLRPGAADSNAAGGARDPNCLTTTTTSRRFPSAVKFENDHLRGLWCQERLESHPEGITHTRPLGRD